MIDQLTIILNKDIITDDLGKLQTQLQQLRYGNTKIDSVIDHFYQNVILQNEKSNQTFQVQFGDIIEFKHSHPLTHQSTIFYCFI